VATIGCVSGVLFEAVRNLLNRLEG